MIESSPEKDGLIQASILPANSECKFEYSKSLEVSVADWIFYSLFGVAFLAGLYNIIKSIVKY